MTKEYRNPALTVDIIIEIVNEESNKESNDKKIVLINRKNPPYGWALPGGFVDYGETLENAAVREALEETSLQVELIRQFHTYSEPSRDPRQHTVSTVFIAKAKGMPLAADDALEAKIFSAGDLPDNIAFDHADILKDYRQNKY